LGGYLTHGANSPSSPEEPHRRERSLAIARVFLAASVFIAAAYTPSNSEGPSLRPLFLAGYLVVAAGVLLLLRTSRGRRPLTTGIVHAIDVVAATGVALLTGAGGPFLLVVLFPLIAAAHRWGFRATIATAGAIVGLLVTHAVLVTTFAAADPGQPGALKLLGVRTALVLMAGVLLGYVTQTEKRIRAEGASIAAIVSRVELRTGLSKAMALVCMALFYGFFVSLVVRSLI